MHKLFIKNRKGQKISVIVEQPQGESKGLAFVMDGLSGFKESDHIRAIAESFIKNGFIIVTFDTTNSFGESDGNYEDATITNYLEDLEDVIGWAKKQSWYQEPFCLAGHSLGGISTALYAEHHPAEIKALAPIAMFVTGKLTIEKYKTLRPKELEIWERTGIREEISKSRAGLIKKLKWRSYKEDILKYNLLTLADRLIMPILLIVGDKDENLEQQKMLFKKLPGQKEIHIVKGAPHTFRTSEHLADLKQIFDQWIKKLN